MKVNVRLQQTASDDSNGVKLWAIAQDGSDRRWFKWYENGGVAIIDAENMDLIEDTQFSSSGSRYASNIHRKLFDEVEIADEVLNEHWHFSPTTTS